MSPVDPPRAVAGMCSTSAGRWRRSGSRRESRCHNSCKRAARPSSRWRRANAVRYSCGTRRSAESSCNLPVPRRADLFRMPHTGYHLSSDEAQLPKHSKLLEDPLYRDTRARVIQHKKDANKGRVRPLAPTAAAAGVRGLTLTPAGLLLDVSSTLMFSCKSHILCCRGCLWTSSASCASRF